MSRLMQPRSLRALAFKIADEAALQTIHSFCQPADAFGTNRNPPYHFAWYLPGVNDEARADTLEAIRYGVARGLVIRNRRAGIVAIAEKRRP